MARKADKGDWELEPDNTIEDLVRNVRPGRSVAFRGWLSRGDGDTVRLYRTLALEEYLEVDAGDVLRSLPLGEGGASAIWVPSGASVRVVHVVAADQDRHLREGPIASGSRCEPDAGRDPCADPCLEDPTGLIASYAFTKRTTSRAYCC